MPDEFDPSQPFYKDEFDPSQPFESEENDSEYGLAFQPDPLADVGPPSDGVPEESLRPRQRGIVERSARGLLQDLPLKETLGGAVEASYEKLVKDNPAKFLDLYRKSRDEHRQFWDNERDQNGTAGKVAAFAGNLAPGVASMALPGGPIAQGAIMGGLTGLDQSRADLTKGEVGQAIGDTAVGAGIGAAGSYIAPKAISALARPIQTAGKALQVPQRAKDAFGSWFGGTKLAKWAGGADEQVDDVLKSSRVKDLEATVKDATRSVEESVPLPKDDFATRLARASNRGTADISPEGGFTVDPAEFGDDFARMQEGIIDRAAAKNYPDMNRDDVGPGINVFDEARTRLKRAVKVESGGGTNPPIRKTSGDTPTKIDALGSSADELSPAAAESIRNQSFRKDVSTGIQDEERALINKAIELKEKIAQSDAMAADKFVTDTSEANRLKSVADSARDELQNIFTSNRALGRILGGAAGAKAGGAIGGIPGAIVGAQAGASGGSKALQTIDWAGAAGQRLSKVSSIADQLSLRDDAVGRMARFALSGDNQRRSVNMMLLSEMPEVQDLIGMDK